MWRAGRHGPVPARAQQSAKHWRIGLLASQPLAPIGRFKSKLRDLGYVEGENLLIEARFSEGRDELYPAFAEELLSKSIDLVLSWGTPAAFAAKQATTTVPIVLVAGDVLNTGIVKNLARPEGNITGFIAVNVELEEKRIELAKELVPDMKRIGVLANARNPLNVVNIETVKRAAALANFPVDFAEVHDRVEIDEALERLAAAKPDAALLGSDLLLLSERKKITGFMAARRVPAIYPFREYAREGGLIVHGANIATLFERAAVYVDRILKGARPADLPVQQATAFELIVNAKATAAIGLRVPASILARADEVIE